MRAVHAECFGFVRPALGIFNDLPFIKDTLNCLAEPGVCLFLLRHSGPMSHVLFHPRMISDLLQVASAQDGFVFYQDTEIRSFEFFMTCVQVSVVSAKIVVFHDKTKELLQEIHILFMRHTIQRVIPKTERLLTVESSFVLSVQSNVHLVNIPTKVLWKHTVNFLQELAIKLWLAVVIRQFSLVFLQPNVAPPYAYGIRACCVSE